MKKLYYIIYISIFFTSCIEPFDLKTIDHENNLVVEAIITNELKKHQIKLSRTTQLELTEPTAESNATIIITDNSNNTYSFSEKNPGIYVSDINFKAELNKSYKIKITTSDNKIYSSTEEKIAGLGEINDVSGIIEDQTEGLNGISIYVKSNILDENANYFKYSFEETYKIETPLWTNENIIINSDKNPFSVSRIFSNDKSKVCYISENSNKIIQTETSSLSENKINFKVQYINKSDFKISNRYSILITQQVQSKNAYFYYKTLNKISSSESAFVQNQPGLITGNISSNNNLDENVIGYFEVSSVSKKRLFFNFEDFYPDDRSEYIAKCATISLPLAFPYDPDTSPLIRALRNPKYVFLYYNDFPEVPGENYVLINAPCGDCSTIDNTYTNKPTFWID